MMKPCPQQNETADEFTKNYNIAKFYNYRHSGARKILENLFGMLKNRWWIYFKIIINH